MKPKKLALLLASFLLAAATALAQNQMQEKVTQVKEAIQKNQAALKTYLWKMQTQILYKGDIKATKNYNVVMGPNGKAQKTSTDPPAPPEEQGRRGRLRREIKDHKIGDIKEYMQKAQQLIEQYVPPSGQRIQQSWQTGNGSVSQSGPGVIDLTLKNYVQPNDSMVITFNTETKSILALAINTYIGQEKDFVKLNVSFAKLPDGTNHVARTDLVVKAKDIEVISTNFDYQKL
jgi:hypothetical protein